MNRIIRIGLCGRSGSGKGHVCRKFAAIGIPSVDTDAVYREMTAPCEMLSPCMRELKESFGDLIVSADGSLNRQALSAIVFADNGDEKRMVLNHITHKYILQKTEELIVGYISCGAAAVIIDAPLLFESGFDAHCDCTICVTAPTEVSVKRIMERDAITRDAALSRLASQMSVDELTARCDYVIENGLNCPDLAEQVLRVKQEIFARFGSIGGKV